MSETNKEPDFLKPLPFLQNATSFEPINPPGCSPPKSVSNPPQPYPNHPSYPQVPYSPQVNPYEQLYQLPRNSGYNLQSYGYPQQSTFSGYEYVDYGSFNTNQDVQYPGPSHQNAGSNAPTPFIDYSMVQSTFPYPHVPLVTDITKPPPVFSNTYTHQPSTSESKDTPFVFNAKSDSKTDKNYHSRIDKHSNEDSKSVHRKHSYNRSEYSSSRNRLAKSTSNYRDDQSKHRSHKSLDNSRHRSDRSYKDDSLRSRDTHSKHRSIHRSYSEKPGRGHSREKSAYNDSKYRSSRRNSRSPGKRSPDRYRSCSVSKGKKPVNNDNIPEKNKPDEDHYENRNQISNSIEKACENLTVRSSDDEKSEDEDEPLSKRWYRSSPAELYYVAVDGKSGVVESTPRARKVTDAVREKLIDRGKKSRPSPGTEPIIPPRAHRPKLCKHKSEHVSSSDSSSGSENDEADHAMQELERKQQHPRRLHPEMWYNDPGEMNDGPLCRCSARTKRQGIRHGVYAEEVQPIPCNIYTNNADKLYHYRITISPPTNFLIKTLTVITHDEHEFLFSGFSLLSHYPLTKLPTCKVIRFNIEYTILYIEEQAPINYTIEELELFEEFLFREILELVDLDMGQRTDSGCSQFHLLPRWERALGGGGGEVLAMVEVLKHLIKAGGLLLPPNSLKTLRAASQREWQSFVDGVRGMIVTYPGKKPCSVRVDQLDRSLSDDDIKCSKDETNKDQSELIYPEIVHFGIRPPQLSYAGNPEYKKAWRDYVKFRHLVANMAKPSYEDKRKLESKEARLQEMRTQTKMKRDVTVALSAEGFYRTGIMCDVVQHAMLIPVLISHLRFHNSLNNLEKTINYKFENRSLLQLALTHPSYRDNFGTNPDHARNSLTNCGIRQPEYGDRRIHYMNIRKRGINTLINIMSRFGKKQETESAISHNERLEFLGDAVVEFISSIHLFKMFPSLEEGGLATYRAAIVQNQHLAQLAKKLGLEQYMLYAHGSDLCHDLELRHAMANCFEALMGALFLDGGIDVADRVFAIALWKGQPDLLEAWKKPRLHPLQEQEPYGDRRWLDQYPFLQNLTKFEDSIGIKFTHIRLLARAFTDRSMGFTNLTLGSNQRLEFLGDTVLQLISSEHLYKHFPEHHEGHLSLLRSSLVNNRTQAVVCDDLAMSSYAVYHNPKAEPKTKDKADLLEAFLGALYIDKNIEYCHSFCSVCLFPRLREFIMNQEWNDPKSKLQQCCLTLRTMDGAEPDIPIYKVIECVGPTNTREYTVAVYFRGERLASARGHCIQEAEMNAAKQALTNSHNLFPQLDRQKRVIAKSMKRQRHNTRRGKYNKMDYDRNKDRSEGHHSNSKESSRKKRSSLDRSPGKSDSKQKKNKQPLDKFPSIKDKSKLPMAYRPDRFDNDKNDDDSDDNSTNLEKSLVELSDLDSDIVYSDDSQEKLSVIDSEAE